MEERLDPEAWSKLRETLRSDILHGLDTGVFTGPSAVGAALFLFVLGSKSDNDTLLLVPHDSHLDIGRALPELIYLRAFAVDHTAFALLEGMPEKDQIIAAFRTCVKNLVEFTGLPQLSVTIFVERTTKYFECIQDIHELGRGWNVGSVFAELCGCPKDLRVTVPGITEFVGTAKAVNDLLKTTGLLKENLS